MRILSTRLLAALWCFFSIIPLSGQTDTPCRILQMTSADQALTGDTVRLQVFPNETLQDIRFLTHQLVWRKDVLQFIEVRPNQGDGYSPDFAPYREEGEFGYLFSEHATFKDSTFTLEKEVPFCDIYFRVLNVIKNIDGEEVSFRPAVQHSLIHFRPKFKEPQNQPKRHEPTPAITGSKCFEW